jgi:hypothetical protein
LYTPGITRVVQREAERIIKTDYDSSSLVENPFMNPLIHLENKQREKKRSPPRRKESYCRDFVAANIPSKALTALGK